MKDVTNTMQFILVAMGDVVRVVMGGVDGFLYALIVFVGVECATGIMVGVISKERFSQLWFQVAFKKVMIFFLVALAHIIDNFVIRNGGLLRTAVILFVYGGNFYFGQRDTHWLTNTKEIKIRVRTNERG